MEEAWAEIEALRAIFEDEIIITKHDNDPVITVQKKVKPNEVKGVSSASVITNFILSPQYPHKRPEVVLSNPRGITNDAFLTLERNVSERLKELDGSFVVYEIIQLCSDFLIESKSSDQLLCAICLDFLSLGETICTKCEHYVHQNCYLKFVEFRKKELKEELNKMPHGMKIGVKKILFCPVCREEIDNDLDLTTLHTLACFQTEPTSNDNFDFDWESWRLEKEKNQILYDKQKRQGGIIDLEEERKKNLIEIDSSILASSSVVSSSELLPESTGVDQKQTIDTADKSTTGKFLSSSSRLQSSENEREQRYTGRGYRKYTNARNTLKNEKLAKPSPT